MALLGCIADDFTGATDLASILVQHGMATVQMIGVPGPDVAIPEADALIVALKSRTIPAAEAKAQSLAALAWLQAAGCQRFYFKYCSTFDSTEAGNIGPVLDVLSDALKADLAIACPALPVNGRSVYMGHLFVKDRLLSESGMEHHPLTPMTDPDLVRVLGRQTEAKVGLVPYPDVAGGAAAIAAAMARLQAEGCRYAIVDAIDNEHLAWLGEAVADHRLVSGGSGVAIGLPAAYRAAGLLAERAAADRLPPVVGRSAILSGSCSRATLGQVEHARAHLPVFELDPLSEPDAEKLAAGALEFSAGALEQDGPILIAASAGPDKVAALQERLGREAAGSLVEETMARIARGLAQMGVNRLVVAGGETSGAVVSALGVKALKIGQEIDPGVPWTAAATTQGTMLLALKSGNFGARDFFTKAWEMIR